MASSRLLLLLLLGAAALAALGAAPGAEAGVLPPWERSFKLPVYSYPPKGAKSKIGGKAKVTFQLKSMYKAGKLDEQGRPVKAEPVLDADVSSKFLAGTADIERSAGKTTKAIGMTLWKASASLKFPREAGGVPLPDKCGPTVKMLNWDRKQVADDPRKWEFNTVKVQFGCEVDYAARMLDQVRPEYREHFTAILKLYGEYVPSADTLKTLGKRGDAVKKLVEANMKAAEAQAELVKKIDQAMDAEKALKAAKAAETSVEEGRKGRLALKAARKKREAAEKAYKASMKALRKEQKAAAKAAKAARKQAQATAKVVSKLTAAVNKADDAVHVAEATNAALKARQARLATQLASASDDAARAAIRAQQSQVAKQLLKNGKRLEKLRTTARIAKEALAAGGKRAAGPIGRAVTKVAATRAAMLLGKVVTRFVPLLNVAMVAHDLYQIGKIIYYWDSYEFGWFAGESGEPSGMKRTPRKGPASGQGGDASELPPDSEYLGGRSDQALKDAHRAPEGGGGGGGDGDDDSEDPKKNPNGGGTGGGTGGNNNDDGTTTTTDDDGTTEQGEGGGTVPSDKREPEGVRPARPGEEVIKVDDGGELYTTMYPGDEPCAQAAEGARCQKTAAPCAYGAFDAKATCGGRPDLTDRQCCVPFPDRMCSRVGECVASAADCAGDGREVTSKWMCAAAGAACCVRLAQTQEADKTYTGRYWRDATCEKVGGTCQKDSFDCEGKYQSGLCGGSQKDRRCCLPANGGSQYTKRHWADWKCDAVKGKCQFSREACAGHYTSSKCGTALKDRMCCVPNGEGGTGAGGGKGDKAGNDGEGDGDKDGGGGGGGKGTGDGDATGDGKGTGDGDAAGDDGDKDGGNKGEGGEKKAGGDVGTGDQKKGEQTGDGGDGETHNGEKDWCPTLGGKCLAAAGDKCDGVVEVASHYCGGLKAGCCLPRMEDEITDDAEAEAEAAAAAGDEKADGTEEDAETCPPGRVICLLNPGMLVTQSGLGKPVVYDEAKVAAHAGQVVEIGNGLEVQIVRVETVPIQTIDSIETGSASKVQIFGARVVYKVTKNADGAEPAVGTEHTEQPDMFWVELSAENRHGRYDSTVQIKPLLQCLVPGAAKVTLNPSCPATVDMGTMTVRVVSVSMPFVEAESVFKGTVTLDVASVKDNTHGFVMQQRRYKPEAGQKLKLELRFPRPTKVAN